MGMRDTNTGAEVSWDWQLGTFTGVVPGQPTRRAASIDELEAQLGSLLDADTRAYLAEMKVLYPHTSVKRTVTKLQFMALFRPDDLFKIYRTARGGVGINETLSITVQIALARVDRASNDTIDLDDPDTVKGLVDMETYQLIAAGDAERIKKGLPWA